MEGSRTSSKTCTSTCCGGRKTFTADLEATQFPPEYLTTLLPGTEQQLIAVTGLLRGRLP